MEILPFIQKLLYGLFLGAVVGLEREHISQTKGFKAFAGIRTYSLIGSIGVLLSVVEGYSIELFLMIAAAVVGLLIATYVTSTIKLAGVGATSEVAAIVVLIVGYLVGLGEFTMATIITVATFLLLYVKKPLHYFARVVKKEEMHSIIQFIVIALIVLPLLPNQTFGPYDALNPHLIWLMVVLISGISFAGYLGMKLFGAGKGISVTGFLGGLISSTAVAFSFSKNSKVYKAITNPFVFGMVIASAAMFFRVLLEVLIVNRDLLSVLWIPLVITGAFGLLISFLIWYFWLRHENKKTGKGTEVKTGKPLDLVGALKFGVLFAVILLVSKAADAEFGEKGIYVTSIISGLVDTDAISVSLANLAKDEISHTTAAIGIGLAALSNTMVKAFVALAFARKKVGLRTFGALLLIVVVGGLSLLLI